MRSIFSKNPVGMADKSNSDDSKSGWFNLHKVKSVGRPDGTLPSHTLSWNPEVETSG